jgi:glycosyltransferase involved in cell wall biosynthesis
MLIYLGRRGGGNIYSLEIAKALSQKAEVLSIISKQCDNLDDWEKSGISILEVDTYNNLIEFFISTLNLKRFLYIKKEIKKFNPDVIYYPMIHLWTPIINFMNKKIPIVTTLHDPVLHIGEKNLILWMIQRLSIKRSSRIIILSKIFLPMFNKNIRDKIDVIPHGEFSFYKQKNEDIRSEVKEHKDVLLFFGRIKKYKGLDILLSAFPLVKTEIPDAKLIIAGYGDTRPYSLALKNSEDIELINRWIDDSEINDIFSKADVVVLPYIEASQSGVIPLSFALKVPVIATNVGGLSEQVENGKDGILVEPKEPHQLAQACVKILKDKNFAEQITKCAYEKALSEWNWDKIADSLLNTFKKITI